jgi:hypothetical protein
MFCDVFNTFLIFENYVNVAYKGTGHKKNFFTYYLEGHCKK